MDGKYRIVSKVIKDIDIEGFILEDSDGKQQAVGMGDAVKLARAGRIDGAEAVLRTDTYAFSLLTDVDLSKMPTVRNVNNKELSLTYRIVDDTNRCLGYKAYDMNGKVYKLSINKAWSLAINHSIKDVTAIIIKQNDKYYRILRGTNDFKLSKLPRVHE